MIIQQRETDEYNTIQHTDVWGRENPDYVENSPPVC